MSFWSKLGKGALKVAPIAAGFIPGVGPLASMAIGAGTSALSKKLEGGSWKDAAISGAVGGATGYASGKLGGLVKGKIGPSDPTKYVKDATTGISDRLGKLGGGALEHLGTAAKTAGQTGLAKKLALTALGATPALAAIPAMHGGGGGPEGTFGPGVYGGDQPGSFGDFNYRNPNLRAAMQQGKMKARGLAPSFVGRY